MDEKAEIYRARATQLRKIADATSDDTTRKSLGLIIADYEKLAREQEAKASSPS